MHRRGLLQNARIKISTENNHLTSADMVLQLLHNIGPGWRTDPINGTYTVYCGCFRIIADISNRILGLTG